MTIKELKKKDTKALKELKRALDAVDPKIYKALTKQKTYYDEIKAMSFPHLPHTPYYPYPWMGVTPPPCLCPHCGQHSRPRTATSTGDLQHERVSKTSSRS